jgi:transcription antitermination factor NusG
MRQPEKKWFVILVHKRSEVRMGEYLTKRKFECFVPVYSVPLFHGRTRKLPLFEGFVFVYIRPDEIEAVRQYDGVKGMIYWQDKPVIVAGDEIDTIRKFLREYDQVYLEQSSPVPGEKVKILQVPIAEFQPGFIKIQLPSLGYNLVTRIGEAQHLRLIFPRKQFTNSEIADALFELSSMYHALSGDTLEIKKGLTPVIWNRHNSELV